MSTAPSQLQQSIEAEVRDLDRHRRTLEHALAEARRADDRTAAELAQAQARIVAATQRAVPDPDDAGIPQRITDAVEQSFRAATKALHEHWGRICELLSRALGRAAGELAEKQKALRRIEGELGGRGSAGRF